MTTEAPPEQRYKRTMWLRYPMVYVDSYGWAWGLTSGCQTVCAGRIEKLLERVGVGSARDAPEKHQD